MDSKKVYVCSMGRCKASARSNLRQTPNPGWIKGLRKRVSGVLGYRSTSCRYDTKWHIESSRLAVKSCAGIVMIFYEASWPYPALCELSGT